MISARGRWHEDASYRPGDGHATHVRSRPDPLPLWNAVDRARSLPLPGGLSGSRDFVAENHTAGLLVLKDGETVVEEYALGNRLDTLWNGFSMAKFVVSLLFGAAKAEGSIGDMSDSITQYLPSLRSTAYNGVTLRHLLQMSSGVAWMESHTNPRGNLAALVALTESSDSDAIVAYMGGLRRVAEPGSRFNYNTGEVYLAGAVLRAATGRTVAEYLGERIWRPFGMEHPAAWRRIGQGEMERAGCCLYASLRDWGRLGLFALENGGGLLPSNWMSEATRPAQGFSEFGYFTWLHPSGAFSALGIFGQVLYVDPSHDLVIVLQSCWPTVFSTQLKACRNEFIEGVAAAFSEA